MKQKHTGAKKARRFNYWPSYQNDIFSTPVFWRRVRGFFGADHKAFSQKHLSLDGAVEGYKARLDLAQQGTHIKQ